MALAYYIYGEVVFTTAQKRQAAGRRLDQRAGKAGFTAQVWPQLVAVYGSWPAGHGDITKDGLPAMRFCYMTMDEAVANEAAADITAAWDVFSDSDSFWSWAAVPV